MVSFHDGQVIKLRADLRISPILLREHSQEAIEAYVRNKLARDLVKQIMDEDLITIKHVLHADPLEDEHFTTELTVIQE